MPGLGQFYNESYWKIPVIWGTLGYLIYQWNRNNNLYIQYRDQFNASLSDGSGGNARLKDIREFYRDQKDQVIVYIGLTYFLNLIDAYVDAHLFDIEVPKNNQFGSYRLSLKINF